MVIGIMLTLAYDQYLPDQVEGCQYIGTDEMVGHANDTQYAEFAG